MRVEATQEAVNAAAERIGGPFQTAAERVQYGNIARAALAVALPHLKIVEDDDA